MTFPRFVIATTVLLTLVSCGSPSASAPTETVTVFATPAPPTSTADIWDTVEPVVENEPEIPNAPQGVVTSEFRDSTLGALYTPWTSEVIRAGDIFTAEVRDFTDRAKADEICYALRETFTDGTQPVVVKLKDTGEIISSTGGEDNLCPQQ